MRSVLATLALACLVILYVGVGNTYMLSVEPRALDSVQQSDIMIARHCNTPATFTDAAGKQVLESSYRCLETYKRGAFTIFCEQKQHSLSHTVLTRICQITG